MPISSILIVGGGFAGMAAARALRHVARSGSHRVTLIDRRTTSVMLPALPDYAAGRIGDEALTGSIPERLPPGVRFHATAVHAVDMDRRRVETPSGGLSYDFLILATGSRNRPVPPDWPSEAGYALCSLEEAKRIRDDLPRYLATTPRPNLLFHGGGYTALETATAAAEAARRAGCSCRICIVERDEVLMPFLHEAERSRVRRCLARWNVEIRTTDRIEAFDGRTARLRSGEEFETPMLFRADGSRSGIPAPDGVPALADGRLRVDPTLAIPGHPECFAAGDAAAFEHRGAVLRKAVNFACFAGARAGKNIARILANRPPRPFQPLDAGWVVPLTDDSVGRAFGRIPLFGTPGLRIHYLMCGLRNYRFANFRRFLRLACRPVRAHSE